MTGGRPAYHCHDGGLLLGVQQLGRLGARVITQCSRQTPLQIAPAHSPHLARIDASAARSGFADHRAFLLASADPPLRVATLETSSASAPFAPRPVFDQISRLGARCILIPM